MRLRLLLTTAAVTTALASFGLMPAADAALNKSKKTATHVLPCNDGSGKSARVWYPASSQQFTSWAADNPCRTQWIVMNFGGGSVSDPYGDALSVAPRAHFHRSSQIFYGADTEPGELSVRLSPARSGCHEGWTLWEVRRNDHGRFRVYEQCPGYADGSGMWPAPNSFHTLDCRGSGGDPTLWWDAERLKATNPCEQQWVYIVILFETPDRGNDTTVVRVSPGESLDQTWDLLGVGDAQARVEEWYQSSS